MTQTAENNNRKTLIVGIGVVLLLVVAIAVAAARGVDETPVAEKPAEAPLESPSASATPPAAIPGTGSAPATGTAVAGNAKPGSTGKPGTPGDNPAAPKAPAAAGSQLTTLTVPPDKTIGMIVVPDGFTSGTYEITFKPYGWGPAGQQGGRLVAQIATAKAVDEGAKSLKKEFEGRNATLWCAGPVADDIDLGGQYKGVMVVRPQGDVGVLYLTKITPSK